MGVCLGVRILGGEDTFDSNHKCLGIISFSRLYQRHVKDLYGWFQYGPSAVMLSGKKYVMKHWDCHLCRPDGV